VKKSEEFVDYRGERFYLQTTKRYYQSGRKDVDERSLHRRIWSEVHGPIPSGMAIHHKDGDWRNNDISNLEMMPIPDHARMHCVERWAGVGAKAFLSGLEKARDAAKAWHSSEEGLAWHRANGTRSWSAVEKQAIVCPSCEKEFMGHPSAGATFCSKSCSQRATYHNRFTEPATCQNCGVGFVTSRYRAAKFCSRACSNRARHAAKAEQIDAKI